MANGRANCRHGREAVFYQRLFEIDPATRPLYKTDNLAEQRRKLMQVLGTAVTRLDRMDDLVPIVEHLGRRHERYGVTEEHYRSAGTALLWTLEQGLGRAWTAEAKAAWREVYALLPGVMLREGASAFWRSWKPRPARKAYR